MTMFTPDEEVLHYCEHIMNVHIQTLRSNKNTGTWYWDYPAMVAICHDQWRNVKRASYSHYPQKDAFLPVLDSKLKELGTIDSQSKKPGKRYIIGNCAE